MSDAPEFLTVPELADLLRIKERKVYDLAASGEVPCSRATGKLLFPEADVRAWIDGKKSGVRSHAIRPAVVLGSYDPLFEWALRQSQCGLATLLDGSRDGVDRFAEGEGIAAGVHLHDPATGEWNVSHVSRVCAKQDAVLITFSTRARGLVMRPDATTKFATVGDLTGARIAGRQSGSGADLMFRHLLQDASVSVGDLDFTDPMRSEQDAVQAVLDGDADVTFGLEAIAQPYGLAFAPLVEEEFDLLVDRRAFFELPFQTLLAFCRSDRFLEKANGTAGCSVADLGEGALECLTEKAQGDWTPRAFSAAL